MKSLTSESAARRRIRFESDFDPGSLTVPEISLMGCNTISVAFNGFSAVEAEAEAETLTTTPTSLRPIFSHLSRNLESPVPDPSQTDPKVLGFSLDWRKIDGGEMTMGCAGYVANVRHFSAGVVSLLNCISCFSAPRGVRREMMGA
ncbi:hypothetical protein Sjap_020527 [Stephania japonica]|uniref:Uncharacterized protein n=1 Tax=Stephania japonica TaxID=461633 RepID=A0AAP0HVN0_9MAGN